VAVGRGDAVIRSIVLAGAALFVALLPAAGETPQRLRTEKTEIVIETVVGGLNRPWGLAFLPDGRMLVTERPGRLRLVSETEQLLPPLNGTPRVHVGEGGDAGLLDVALDPRSSVNCLVYLTYSEPREGGAATAAGRGQLNAAGTALESFRVIFRQEPGISSEIHFGSGLALPPDGKLFVSTGERGQPDRAQDLSDHLGKLIRINPDGSVPFDNPFVSREDARPEIWSYGHRNIEGLALQPRMDWLWAGEFGPTGGDEINIIEPGRNYGWPPVSWGEHVDGRKIPTSATRPDLSDAVRHGTPSVSFSGMTSYTGSAIPNWRGNLFLAGLGSGGLIRLTLNATCVVSEERISFGERIRQVVQGPDGQIYLLTDEENGRILRLEPVR